jgi:hypothetical protein
MKRLALLATVLAACVPRSAPPPAVAPGPAPHAQLATAIEAPAPPAVGTLEVPDAHGEPQTVALESIEVDAHVEGDFIDAEVDHVFDSRVEARSEGTFRFPLPDGAILLGLAMEIDGKMMRGELVEREKAQKVFEQIEDQMRDPALLEWDQGSVFKLRVFPLDPGEHKHIVLHYAAPLRAGGFAYPIQPAPGQVIGHAKVVLDGKTLLDESAISARRDVAEPTASWPSTLRRTGAGVHRLRRRARRASSSSWTPRAACSRSASSSSEPCAR